MQPEVKDAIDRYSRWRRNEYDYSLDDSHPLEFLNDDRAIIADHFLDQHSPQPVDFSQIPEVEDAVDDGESYLIANGWNHVMTEEDGCDTWSYPWERRSEWPKWTRDKHGTQHFWDLDEAVELQQQIVDSMPQQQVDWPTEPGWWWMEIILEGDASVGAVKWTGDRLITHGIRYRRDDCDHWKARFLPAFVPTFPPREAT